MVVNDFSIHELIAALGDKNDDVRRGAQFSLHELGVAAIAPLGDALVQGSPDVRRRAAALLANVGDARAVSPLIAALKVLQNQCEDLTLVQIVDALGHFGDPRSVKALAEALPNASSHVQRRIIGALVSIGDQRAAKAIRPLVNDKSVGQTAQWALYQLGE